MPFVIMAMAGNRTKRGLVVAASVLVVLGVACKRAWLLFTSFITPNVYGAPGVAGGSPAARDGGSIWGLLGTYAPTLPECLIVLGVVSLGVLAFMLLSNKLLVDDAASVSADQPEAAAQTV